MKRLRKIVAPILLLAYVTTPTYADINPKLSVQLAKTQKLDEVIDRVNSIHSYINQYLIETADLIPTQNKLIDRFGINMELFKSYTSQPFGFIVDNNKVKYSNVISASLTQKEKDFYTNSSALHPQAEVLVDDNYNMVISLNANAQLFLKQISEANINISLIAPESKSDLWYKPDGEGGYDTYKYNTTIRKWLQINSNTSKNKTTKKIDIVNSKQNLSSSAIKGDISYVKSDDNSSLAKYIYNGTAWFIQSGGVTNTSANSCEVSDVGVMRYSRSEDCMQRCVVSDGSGSWGCIHQQ